MDRAPTIFLACLTKETAAPFLLAIGVVCARDDDHDGWLPPLRVLGPMIGGAVAAIVVNVGFNLFRFGTVTNLTYNTPYTRVPGVVIKAKLAIADWLAPNVGRAVLLDRHRGGPGRRPRRRRGRTGASARPAPAMGAGPRRRRHHRRLHRRAGVVVVDVRLAGVGSSPHAAALAGARGRGGAGGLPGPLDTGLQWLVGSTARAVVTGAVLSVLAVGQAGVVWNQVVIALPTVPTESCPVLKAPWETTPDYFYGCGLDAAWRTRPLALWEAAGHGPRTQHLAEVLQVLTIAGLVAWLAADVRRRPGQPPRRRADEPSQRPSTEKRGDPTPYPCPNRVLKYGNRRRSRREMSRSRAASCAADPVLQHPVDQRQPQSVRRKSREGAVLLVLLGGLLRLLPFPHPLQRLGGVDVGDGPGLFGSANAPAALSQPDGCTPNRLASRAMKIFAFSSPKPGRVRSRR